jgi:hypothetical protein
MVFSPYHIFYYFYWEQYDAHDASQVLSSSLLPSLIPNVDKQTFVCLLSLAHYVPGFGGNISCDKENWGLIRYGFVWYRFVSPLNAGSAIDITPS